MNSPSESTSPLAELEAALSRQMELLRTDSLDELEAVCRQVEDLQRRMAGQVEELQRTASLRRPSLCDDDMRRLERIDRLYRQLGLIVAERKSELRAGLARVRQGKAGLRAYGENAPR